MRSMGITFSSIGPSRRSLSTLPVSPKRKFGQARKHCKGEHNRKENARTKRHEICFRKRHINRAEQEDRSGCIAVQSAASPRVHHASDAHDQQGRNPQPWPRRVPVQTDKYRERWETPKQYARLSTYEIICLAALAGGFGIFYFHKPSSCRVALSNPWKEMLLLSERSE